MDLYINITFSPKISFNKPEKIFKYPKHFDKKVHLLLEDSNNVMYKIDEIICYCINNKCKKRYYRVMITEEISYPCKYMGESIYEYVCSDCFDNISSMFY